MRVSILCPDYPHTKNSRFQTGVFSYEWKRDCYARDNLLRRVRWSIRSQSVSRPQTFHLFQNSFTVKIVLAPRWGETILPIGKVWRLSLLLPYGTMILNS